MNAALQVLVPAALAAAIGFYLTFAAIVRLAPAYRLRFEQTVARQLQRAYLYVQPGRLFVLNLGVAAAVALIAWGAGGGAVVAAGAAAASGLLPALLLGLLRRRRLLAFRHQLPDLMMLAAGSMRAGASLLQALGQSAAEMDVPVRQEIDLVLREQRLGASLDAALAGLERRMPLEETLLLAAAIRISRDTGGNLADTLESLGDAMRRKLAIEGKINALTAQGRLQGWAMGLLPIACGALLSMVEPTAMAALFTTWYGLATCAFVAVMQLLGLYFLRRVTRIEV